MNFLYPQFLWALLVLAIPVIIHLFNFKRYKTVYFSNNRFLQSIQKKSQSFNRLKHFIILCCRMLALALLVIAFAQPFIPAEESVEDRGNYASLYIDNSLSMKARGVEGPLLDEARSRAVELIQSLPENFKVQVITNDFAGKQQNYYSPQEAIQLVDEIQPSYTYRSIEEVKSRLKGPWENLNGVENEKLQVFIFSDFQRSQFSNLKALDEENWKTNLIKFETANQTDNIAIDSVWFEQPVLQPGFDQEVKIKLHNYGTSKADKISVKLELNGQLAGASEYDLPAGGAEVVSFGIRTGDKGDYSGKVTVDASEPYFDNEFYFSFKIEEPLKVLLIGEANKEIFTKLYSDEIYKLEIATINNINYGELNTMDLVILNSLNTFPSGLRAGLSDVLEKGGNLVILPQLNAPEATNEMLLGLNLPTINNVMEGKVRAGKIAYRDLIFNNVFNDLPENPQMPQVERYAKISGTRGFNVIDLENGDPLIARFPRNNGQVLLFTVNLNTQTSTLARHSILVPVMLNSALYSVSRSPLYNTPGYKGGQQFSNSGNAEVPLAIIADKKNIIPPQRNKGNKVEVYSLPTEIEPGIYPVRKDAANLGLLAINVDSRESDWQFWETDELKNAGLVNPNEVLEANAGSISTHIGDIYNGYPLWRWFLAGAILFLLLEILLLKLWK